MKTNEGKVLYQSHKDGLKLCDKLQDATEFQKVFLYLMAGKEIEFKQNIDIKLTGIAKGVGIEFKHKG